MRPLQRVVNLLTWCKPFWQGELRVTRRPVLSAG